MKWAIKRASDGRYWAGTETSPMAWSARLIEANLSRTYDGCKSLCDEGEHPVAVIETRTVREAKGRKQ
jgi:hypothetical protein